MRVVSLAPGDELKFSVRGRPSGNATADARRDRRVQHAGYRIVRLPADLVLPDLPAAVSGEAG
ncbi:MAG: hypothetical protein EOO73_35720 [Myxococcales bacterium]|nr:MAG: hypothetical protein EOO73_35720 [Myxococcales bacterium]